MIADGFSLALLTTAGFIIVYKKLPRKVRRFLEKFSLLTDIVSLLLVYILFGQTLVALFAAAFTGLFVSALLHIANNQEDYLYLYDMRDWIKTQFNAVKEALNAYGKTYREKKDTAGKEKFRVVDGDA